MGGICVGAVGDGGLGEGTSGDSGGTVVSVYDGGVSWRSSRGGLTEGANEEGEEIGTTTTSTYAVFLKLLTTLWPFGHARINNLFSMPPPKLTPLHPVPLPPIVAMKSVFPVVFWGSARPKKYPLEGLT